MNDLADKIRALREEIERQRLECDRAAQRGDMQQAGHLKYALIPMLERKLEQLSRLN